MARSPALRKSERTLLSRLVEAGNTGVFLSGKNRAIHALVERGFAAASPPKLKEESNSLCYVATPIGVAHVTARTL